MVYKDEKDAIIKTFSSEYLNGHDSKELNSDEKKELIKFLTSKMKDTDGNEITCWNQIVEVWKVAITGDDVRIKAFNDLAKKDSHGNYIMPDYSQLEKSKSLTYEDLFNPQ